MTPLAQSAHDVWTFTWHVGSVLALIGLVAFLVFVAGPDLFKPEPPALPDDVDLDELRGTVVRFHPVMRKVENDRWTRGLNG